jgi:tetratricopeptide (TPR) repeat protein
MIPDMRVRAPLIGVLTVALFFGAAPVRADPRDDTEAMHLFEESAVAYKTGNFRTAVTLLERAYALKADPTLQYNLARAFEGLGDLRRAADAYQRYLQGAPDADDVGAVRARLATIRKEIEATERPPPPPVVVKAPRPRSRSPGPWIFGGVGLAAGVTGIVMGALALSRHHAALSAPSQVAAVAAQSDAHAFATAANVAWIGGGVLLGTAVVWAIIDVSTSRPAVARGDAPVIVSW